MWKSIALLCLGTLLLGVSGENPAPIVGLTSGRVIGLVQEIENGTSLHVYQGIPYGRAGRFEKPQFAEPWTDIYNATVARDSCPQPLMPNDPLVKLIQNENLSENCLYLNVWRPADEKTGRAVLFYIHGGAFTIGTIFAPLTDAKYLASRESSDVVVVAVNYRLGPFGFIHGSDVSGNLGLHDQILALRWLKDNIAAFGGDPNKVTIMGASAGSISVGALILSPLTKGLFQRAILQSGTPNSNFAAISPNSAAEKAKKFAAKLDCPSDDIHQAIACIKGKSMDDIRSKLSLSFAKNDFFVPIYGDDVLPVAPIEALKTGQFNQDIDIMTGWTRDEGTYFAAQIMPKLLVTPANLTVESTKEDIRTLLEGDSLVNATVAAEAAELYTQNLSNETSEDELKAIIGATWGDFQLVCPTILFQEAIAKKAPQNRYYSYRLMQPIQMPMPNGTSRKWLGVTHGQDSMLIFMPTMLTRSEDKEMSRELTEAITSFAKTGAPGKFGRDSVEWPEAIDRAESEPVIRYLSLDVADLKMASGDYHKKCNEFWKERTQHA